VPSSQDPSNARTACQRSKVVGEAAKPRPEREREFRPEEGARHRPGAVGATGGKTACGDAGKVAGNKSTTTMTRLLDRSGAGPSRRTSTRTRLSDGVRLEQRTANSQQPPTRTGVVTGLRLTSSSRVIAHNLLGDGGVDATMTARMRRRRGREAGRFAGEKRPRRSSIDFARDREPILWFYSGVAASFVFFSDCDAITIQRPLHDHGGGGPQ
jgi:hypothetical protein